MNSIQLQKKNLYKVKFLQTKNNIIVKLKETLKYNENSKHGKITFILLVNSLMYIYLL